MSFLSYLLKIDSIIDLWLFYKQDFIKKIIPDNVFSFFYRSTYLLILYLFLIKNPDYFLYGASGIITIIILKWSFGRSYPEKDKSINSSWNFFKESISNINSFSFPSGHTFATLLVALLFNNILLWIWFSIVVLSIFFRRNHWSFDIIVGGILTIPFYLLATYIGPIQLFNIQEVIKAIEPISGVAGIVGGFKYIWSLLGSLGL